MLLQRDGQHLIYEDQDIIWLAQYDPEQQVYGLPDYLGGLQSAQLNCDAILFRRRYFLNGAHMGFIFYATDLNMDDGQEEKMKGMIARPKGAGNFRSMFVNIPNGNPDGIKLIPVGDIATKDEFATIKGISSLDMLIVLAGVIPTNGVGGLGDEKYDSTYVRNETSPVCELITDAINGSGIPLQLWVDFRGEAGQIQ